MRSAALDVPLVTDPPIPLVEHLAELRQRLIISLSILGVSTAIAFHWSADLLSLLARPAGGLVFQAPTDAFMARLKIAALAGLAAGLPLVLHQVWLFVGRAMDPSHRRLCRRLIPLSYLLFLLGAGLAVLVVVPAALRFLLSYGSPEVRPLLSVGHYFEFVAKLAIAFGAVFQLPLVLAALNRAGLVSRAGLRERRPYAYVLAFLAAALLTPGPDVISQLALAVPALGLFELTLLGLR